MAASTGVSRIGRGLASSLLAIILTAPWTTAAGQTLVDALVSTYNSNPDLLALRARLRVVDETASQAAAGWRPTVQSQRRYGFDDPDRRLPHAQRSLKPRDRGVNATQPLHRGEGRWPP